MFNSFIYYSSLKANVSTCHTRVRWKVHLKKTHAAGAYCATNTPRPVNGFVWGLPCSPVLGACSRSQYGRRVKSSTTRMHVFV